MIDEIQKLLDEYAVWLRHKTTLREVNQEWLEITSPYLDRHNDYIQIYLKRQNGGYLLTDDSHTIQDLQQSGCALESSKRRSLLNMTLNGFGVQLNHDALEVHASEDNFALRKHNLLQAMLAINDLFYLAVPLVASLFYEDVVSWLDIHKIRYTSRLKFTGKSGFDHLFDFVIPKSEIKPERILRAINKPDKDAAQSLAFAWMDTKEVRPPDSEAFVLLNDSEHAVSSSILDALRNYEVTPILWSAREAVVQELAA
ncbi:MAG: DUF1829 domain-containing protein [Thermoleophilia bacterium]